MGHRTRISLHAASCATGVRMTPPPSLPLSSLLQLQQRLSSALAFLKGIGFEEGLGEAATYSLVAAEDAVGAAQQCGSLAVVCACLRRGGGHGAGGHDDEVPLAAAVLGRLWESVRLMQRVGAACPELDLFFLLQRVTQGAPIAACFALPKVSWYCFVFVARCQPSVFSSQPPFCHVDAASAFPRCRWRHEWTGGILCDLQFAAARTVVRIAAVMRVEKVAGGWHW